MPSPEARPHAINRGLNPADANGSPVPDSIAALERVELNGSEGSG